MKEIRRWNSRWIRKRKEESVREEVEKEMEPE
jgi:hypothetical protein